MNYFYAVEVEADSEVEADEALRRLAEDRRVKSWVSLQGKQYERPQQ